MYALCIRQPWASEIAYGIKTVEYRSWNWSYRGPLVICASKHPAVRQAGELLPSGAAVGIVDLVAVEREPDGTYAFILKNARSVVPVPVHGQVRPWVWNGPELVEIDANEAAPTRERILATSLAEGAEITARARAQAAAARESIELRSAMVARIEAAREKHGTKKRQFRKRCL